MKYLPIIVLCAITLCGCNDYNREKFFESSYKGVISSKYRVKMDHNTPMFDITNDSIDKPISLPADLFEGAYDYASVGDSIIKEAGEMTITIIKPDKTYYIFWYKF